MSQVGWNDILSRDERLLWQERPASDLRLADFINLRLPFGLVFTAFAVFWMSAAFAMTRQTDTFDIFPLFGIPFVLVGLHLVIGAPLWDAYERAHSWYALSDRAAYIATELFGKRKLVRYAVSDMNALELEDGERGTVWFRKEVSLHTSRRRSRTGGSMGSTYTTTTRIGFKRIASPRSVYAMILRLVNAAAETPGLPAERSEP